MALKGRTNCKSQNANLLFHLSYSCWGFLCFCCGFCICFDPSGLNNKSATSDHVTRVVQTLLNVRQRVTLFPPFAVHCSVPRLTHTLAVTSTMRSDSADHSSLLLVAPERCYRRPHPRASLSVYSARVTALKREQWRSIVAPHNAPLICFDKARAAQEMARHQGCH